MAIKGAQAVVDGNIPPLNAADDKKSRMFLWNNIFFSLGFDMMDHYGAFGGDAAAYAAIVSIFSSFSRQYINKFSVSRDFVPSGGWNFSIIKFSKVVFDAILLVYVLLSTPHNLIS